MKRLLVPLVSIGFLVLAGCGTSEPAPRLATSPEDIAGTWERDSEPYYYNVMQVGNETIRWEATLEGLDTPTEGLDPSISEFWFEGTRFNIRDTTISNCLSDLGTYEVRLLADGNIAFELIEDPCTSRTAGLQGPRGSQDKDERTVAEWVPVR